jgi:hypothetical protein
MNGLGMIPLTTSSEDLLVNLAKDGGRSVMHGGDPYEDDLEPVESPSWGIASGNADRRS